MRHTEAEKIRSRALALENEAIQIAESSMLESKHAHFGILKLEVAALLRQRVRDAGHGGHY